MKKQINTVLLIGLSVLAFNVQAAGSAAAGKAKSAACAACHGADGNSPSPAFPRLAGQHEDYIQQALKGYKSGIRKNDIMKGMVAPLSPTDMADLAAYFSSQSGLVVKR